MTNQLFSRQFFAMGSPCQLQLYCSDLAQFTLIADDMVAEVERLEQKFSRYRSDSLLTKINQAAGICAVDIDVETQAICQYAQAAYQLSDGLFDVTTGILAKVWDFKNMTPPTPYLLDSLLPFVNWPLVEISDNSVFLPHPEMQIDFGGIVKEYAADAAKNIAIKNGIEAGLVELGGDISIVGAHQNGQPWHIGIRTATHESTINIQMPAVSGAVASSGDYERFLLLNGKKYGHILNPFTGWPSFGLTAVSVWAEQCVIAGTVATIAMLKGEDGIEWLKQAELPFIAKTSTGQLVQNQ